MRRRGPWSRIGRSHESAHLITYEGSREMNGRPNIVLVHGAWADGSCWSEVIGLLQTAGFGVRRAPVSHELPRRRRGAVAAGARVPGGADHRRRSFLRRADHDRARRRTPPTPSGSSTSRHSGWTRASRSGRCSRRGRSRPRSRTCSRTGADTAGSPRRTSSTTSPLMSTRSRARVMWSRAAGACLVGVHRCDGPAGLEVAADLVPRRTERRGDPARRRAAVRSADGGHDRRDPIEPCCDGFPPGGGR